MTPVRLSVRQVQLLQILARSDGEALGRRPLGERTGLSERQLQITLDSLVGLGAIQVAPQGRGVRVILTNHGRRLCAANQTRREI